MHDALASILHRTVLIPLGQSCTYAGREIRAEFREAHSAVVAEGDTYVQTTGPSIAVRLADLAAPPAHGDAVRVSGRLWRVTEIMPDTAGMARIMLREVSS